MSIASQLVAGQASGLGPEELAGQLLELLGDAAFEAVGELMERRCVEGCGCWQACNVTRELSNLAGDGSSSLCACILGKRGCCCPEKCVMLRYRLLDCARVYASTAGRTCLMLCVWRWPSWQGLTSRAARRRGRAQCPATHQVRGSRETVQSMVGRRRQHSLIRVVEKQLCHVHWRMASLYRNTAASEQCCCAWHKLTGWVFLQPARCIVSAVALADIGACAAVLPAAAVVLRRCDCDQQ
jgi:hypothetical protein